MEKIKEILIHLLGGVTQREINALINNTYKDTRTKTLQHILFIMEGLYGKSADEWCRIVYDYTKKMFETNVNYQKDKK